MQYRNDLKSGNQLSILGFGCMRLPSARGKIDYEKSKQLFDEAIKKGVNYFDTAYLYPGSEAALGQYFEEKGHREKIFIATKLPLVFCKSNEDFDKYFSEQLKRLRTTYIDYYLIHNVSTLSQWKALVSYGIIPWIKKQKDEGKIRQIGFSFHGAFHEFSSLLDAYDWDFCQIQYNYMNINYQAGIAGLKKANEKGLPVIIMEPLLGGRLASGLPEKAVQILNKHNPALSPAAWAFSWLWHQPEVTTVLSGMNEMNQLTENIQTAQSRAEKSFTEEDEKIIEQVIDIFRNSYKIPCTGCNYCLPCPMNINIPGSFAAYNSSYAMNRTTGITQYILNSGALSDQPHYASACIQCGKCESHCPQHIKIRESLKLVTKRLEFFTVKKGLDIYKRFFR